jgi:(1->4)-alpha-D-glucan 1-alpha-D-glucosylmutase
MNEPLRPNGVPDPNVELLVYQNLLSVWPIDRDRFRQFLEKASREAKTHTSWIAPNVEYEDALQAFGDALLTNEEFRRSFIRLQKRAAYHGFLNALAQVVLKITSPGVPDFYQGTELWDFSLVDPDNRRPVDYETRMKLLRQVREANPVELLRRWPDGRIKLYVTWKALQLRKQFAREDYRPLSGERVCAFGRGKNVAVAVPRFTVSGKSSLELNGRWRNVFTNEVFEGGDPFATFPVAIFERV